jgi:hypothetical protein
MPRRWEAWVQLVVLLLALLGGLLRLEARLTRLETKIESLAQMDQLLERRVERLENSSR